MALINPEILALARVKVSPPSVLAYEFSNGFETTSIKGAKPGTPVLISPAPGIVIMFLSEPVAPGSLGAQGGVKARADVVAVSTPSAATPIIPDVDLRWFYGTYAFASNPALVGVDPEKMIVVEAFDTIDKQPWPGTFTFDIVVFRDPMTEYTVKKSVG